VSAYEHDDRVRLSQGKAVVHGTPHDRHVIDKTDAGLWWCIFEGRHMTLLAADYATMDAAIRSLIGDPVVKA